MNKLVFVLDPITSGQDSEVLLASLLEIVKDLPVRQSTTSASREAVKGTLLGSGRSFRNMIVELEKRGLSISSAYRRPDGKVVFVAGETLDSDAELLFLQMVVCTGWSVVHYNNQDGTIVFAAKAPVFLSEMVRVRENGAEAYTGRDWGKYLITI